MNKPVLTALLILLVLSPAAAIETTDLPIALKEDGGKIYAGYETGKIRVLDADSLALLATIDGKEGWIWSVETDKDHIYFGTARSQKTISVTKDGTPVASANHTDFVLAVLLNGGKLYSCDRSGGIKIYSTPDLTMLGSINSSGQCGSLRVDDKYIYAPAQTKNIGVWDKQTLLPTATIKAHDNVIRGVWDDENTLYSTADDNKLKFWNKTGFSLENELRVEYPWDIGGDESMLYVTSGEKIIVLEKGGRQVAVLNAGSPEVNGLAVTGNAVYSLHGDGKIKKWDKRTFTNTATSQVFTYRNPTDASFDKYRFALYALLAVGIVGYVAITLREKKKK